LGEKEFLRASAKVLFNLGKLSESTTKLTALIYFDPKGPLPSWVRPPIEKVVRDFKAVAKLLEGRQ
jgi:hypothetical protein